MENQNSQQTTATAPKLYTITEVCEILQVSRAMVYQLINSGELKSIRLGEATQRIHEDDLNSYIESKR